MWNYLYKRARVLECYVPVVVESISSSTPMFGSVSKDPCAEDPLIWFKPCEASPPRASWALKIQKADFRTKFKVHNFGCC